MRSFAAALVGYDYSASGYRLHASHQMIHQQYAMVPESAPTADGTAVLPAFSSGDLVADTVARYPELHGSDFFRDYLAAIRGNVRTDGGAGPHKLVVLKDENVLLFVPKAQISQWELQLLVIADAGGSPVGNVLEADLRVRAAIDRAILAAQKIYAGLGARMVTAIELPKRFGLQNGQRLIYSFLPKLPWSMGAFSEAQQRFICGHYPEDFVEACRLQLALLLVPLLLLSCLPAQATTNPAPASPKPSSYPCPAGSPAHPHGIHPQYPVRAFLRGC